MTIDRRFQALADTLRGAIRGIEEHVAGELAAAIPLREDGETSWSVLVTARGSRGAVDAEEGRPSELELRVRLVSRRFAVWEDVAPLFIAGELVEMERVAAEIKLRTTAIRQRLRIDRGA